MTGCAIDYESAYQDVLVKYENGVADGINVFGLGRILAVSGCSSHRTQDASSESHRKRISQPAL
ncbi:MAG: hypothetical protein LBC41_01790 [Clostridiales bacterium]|nr:hypothetical protein [Clostridiales bacterium]